MSPSDCLFVDVTIIAVVSFSLLIVYLLKMYFIILIFVVIAITIISTIVNSFSLLLVVYLLMSSSSSSSVHWYYTYSSLSSSSASPSFYLPFRFVDTVHHRYHHQLPNTISFVKRPPPWTASFLHASATGHSYQPQRLHHSQQHSR